MSFLQRIFGKTRRRETLGPLYAAIVAAAREPGWYRDGGVPDTVDGRFDMIAAVTSLVLLRLEREGDAARDASVLLTETFIADMDASLRQIGIGEYVVGKHVGRLMGALGGRLGALREARAAGDGLAGFVGRNIFHETPATDEKAAFVAAGLERLEAALDAMPAEALIRGEWPR